MSGSSAHDSLDEDAPSLEEQERKFLDAQVDTALAAFDSSLSQKDLAWMRERLLEAFEDDPALRALARAACPRDVDQSGEILRGSKRR